MIKSTQPTNLRLITLARSGATKSLYFPRCGNQEAYRISYEYKIQRHFDKESESGIIHSLRPLPGSLRQRRGALAECDPKLLKQMDADFMSGELGRTIENEMARRYVYSIENDTLILRFKNTEVCRKTGTQTGEVISTFRLEAPVTKDAGVPELPEGI